ncbi:MAG: ribulose-phosphate 3-epimerase, partial [Candidatus Sungbacteria bacterium]|nr:ribulose-phosphate 3-epimerase [Candidatus Sungbacteria bacterium]
GLAIADKTSWTKLKSWVDKVDMLQVLSIPAGKAGQEFHRHNLVKIRHLRRICRDCTIEADGGMNPHIAGLAREYGANVIAAASYIFESKDIEKAIEELQNT